jgi:glycosyltransferase involved in cell wall biosynthesis
MEILQLSRGSVYPPSNGEEVRVWKTAEKLMELGSLWVAAPSGEDGPPPGSLNTVALETPLLTKGLLRNECWLGLSLLGQPHPLGRALTRRVVSTVERRGVDPDVVVAEFPQVTEAAFRLGELHDADVLLNKHNAVAEILDSFLKRRPVPAGVRRRAVRNLKAFERRTIEAADVTVFQSAADAERFDCTGARDATIIPNGCEYQSISSGGNPDAVAERLGLDPDAFVCVFVGSFGYAPNREAARLVRDELAPAFPGLEFLLVGRDPPTVGRSNVHAPGFVEDLAGVLSLADIGLCPLFTGSGTKLKMLDYFAAGLPVVSTSVGVQGLPVADGEDVLVYDSVEGFREGIRRLVEAPETRRRLGHNCRPIGRAHSWEQLMARYEPVFERLGPD